MDVITLTYITENELTKRDTFFDKKQMLHLQGYQKNKTSFVGLSEIIIFLIMSFLSNYVTDWKKKVKITVLFLARP